MIDTSRMPFENLSIECDGKHTRIIVDGMDYSRRTEDVNFNFRHDANGGVPTITIARHIGFVPAE